MLADVRVDAPICIGRAASCCPPVRLDNHPPVLQLKPPGGRKEFARSFGRRLSARLGSQHCIVQGDKPGGETSGSLHQ